MRKLHITITLLFGMCLYSKAQSVTLGMEYHESTLIGSTTFAFDSVTFQHGLEQDPKAVFIALMEFPGDKKLFMNAGVSAASFATSSYVFSSFTRQNTDYIKSALYRYKYLDLGIPFYGSLDFGKRYRLFLGGHFHLLLGENQDRSKSQYPTSFREEFEKIGEAIDQSLNKSYLQTRMGIEMDLLNERLVLSLVYEKGLTGNLSSKGDIGTLKNWSTGAGLRYRIKH